MVFNIFSIFKKKEKDDKEISNKESSSPFKAVPVDESGFERIKNKSWTGCAFFYNEVDHTRGRFLDWIRTPADQDDERVIKSNSYRAKIAINGRILGIIPTHKIKITPPVFTEGVDFVTFAPGSKPGIPSEGLVVLKRSIDGLEVKSGHEEMMRHQIMDERHRNDLLSTVIFNIQEKERTLALDDSSKELADNITAKLKRTRKMHDAATGRREGMDTPGFGASYGNEMYGPEESSFGGSNVESPWKLEG